MDENMPRSAGRVLADAGHDVVYLRLHPIDGPVAGALAAQALADAVQGQFIVCTPNGRRRRALPQAAGG
jgi:hypothetical protein